LQHLGSSLEEHWFESPLEPPHGSVATAAATGSTASGVEEGAPPRLASIEEGLRLAIDLGGADLVLCDPQTWRFLDGNRSAHERLGYSREEFLALDPAALQADPQHDQCWVRERMGQMRRQPCGSFATRHRGRDGRLRDVFATTAEATRPSYDNFLALALGASRRPRCPGSHVAPVGAQRQHLPHAAQAAAAGRAGEDRAGAGGNPLRPEG
jgi:PAS domain-containing protein